MLPICGILLVQTQASYRLTWGKMRNLKLLKSFRSSGQLGPGSPQCLALRADTDSFLVASQYSIVEYNPRTDQVIHWWRSAEKLKKEFSNIYLLMCASQVVREASLTTQGFLPGDGSGVVVGLKDLAELESACLATAGGDVVLFNLNTCQVKFTGSFLHFGLI